MPAQILPISLLLLLAACGSQSPSPTPDAAEGPPSLRAMTFNAGTPDCDRTADAGYTCADASVAAEWYGTGLAHRSLLPDVASLNAAVQPDLLALQEIFDVARCTEIPVDAHTGFICEGWQEGDPGVAEQILGEGYQVACHQGRADKCLAVRRAIGQFRGCSERLCRDHLQGGVTEDCGGGTRVGRGVIDLVGGGELTVVSIHGTSGFTPADQQCRITQFEQVFLDLRDGGGRPGADGGVNLVLGDLNTDPGRLALIDRSAARWNDFVGDGQAFTMLTPVGLLVPPTYANLLNIDHVASDRYAGTCFSAVPSEQTAFDHQPIVCDLFARSAATAR